MEYDFKSRKKDTAIVNLTDALNVIDLYEDGDLEKALELAIGLLALGFGASFETNDREIQRLLRSREYTSARDNQKYLNVKNTNAARQRNKLQVDEILDMLSNGAKQSVMADSLAIPLATLKYRIRVIKEKYSEEYNEAIEKCKKYKKYNEVSKGWRNDKVNDKDKDNDKVNDKDNEKEEVIDSGYFINGDGYIESLGFYLGEKYNKLWTDSEETRTAYLKSHFDFTDEQIADINEMVEEENEYQRNGAVDLGL